MSAGPILPAFGPVPTAVDIPVAVLRRKHDYKKKKKKKKIYPSQDSAACSMFMIKKHDMQNEARFLYDLVDRNANTRKDNTPIPDITSIVNTIARHTYRSKIDLTDGCHNIRIKPESEEFTLFYTPFRTFRTRVKRTPTTTSTRRIFEILPGYLLQFSDSDIEARLHRTSFSSGFSWCFWIRPIFSHHRAISSLLFIQSISFSQGISSFLWG